MKILKNDSNAIWARMPDGAVILISYDKVIVSIKDGVATLDSNYWDYSTTTSKHRNAFLKEDKKQTMKKIDAGVYKLANLNEGV